MTRNKTRTENNTITEDTTLQDRNTQVYNKHWDITKG